MEVAKVTSKGQVTLPKNIRDKFHITTGDLIAFVISGNKAELMRLGSLDDFYGSIPVKNEQDFKNIRYFTKRKKGKEVACEGK